MGTALSLAHSVVVKRMKLAERRESMLYLKMREDPSVRHAGADPNHSKLR